MGVPSTRTPVRIARGTYANLSTVNALAALDEGEICFATDQQRLYVKQGGGLTSISASSQAAPAPADVTASPAFAGGVGTEADPYQITSVGVPIAGATVLSAQTITFSGTAGDFLLISDDSESASGDRFASQDVSNMDSAGKVSLQLRYIDDPATSVNNTTYIGKFSVGTTHFIWTVVQSNLTELSQDTAATISGTASINNTITSSAGSVTGGTSTYSLTGYQWQKSFDGSTYFDLQGETNTGYTIVSADASTYLRCAVSYSDSTPGAAGGPLTITLFTSPTAPIPSISAPVIDVVSLTEDDATGARFTSQTFSAGITMVNDGSPVSQKGIKGSVQASFTVNSTTDALTSYNNSVTTNVFTTPYTSNLTNFQDYQKTMYVYVGDHSDDYRMLRFLFNSGGVYVHSLNDDFSHTEIQFKSLSYAGTPYINLTQVCNRNGLLYFHGVGDQYNYSSSNWMMVMQANNPGDSIYINRSNDAPSACDGHILWHFNSAGTLRCRYNSADTTNYSLALPGAFNTDTNSSDLNSSFSASTMNSKGGFAHVAESDELVFLRYYNNYMYTYVWSINRQSGVAPDSTWITWRGNTQTMSSVNQFGGSWDLGEHGYWCILDVNNVWGIYKYNPSNRQIYKVSNLPSEIYNTHRLGMGVDREGNLQLCGFKNGNVTNLQYMRSANGGASWQDVGEVVSASSWADHFPSNYASAGNYEIWGGWRDSSGSDNFAVPYRVFSNQTATVTSSSLDDFGDLERIAKYGDENNIAYKGTLQITNRTSGQVKLNTSGIWQNGDVVVSRSGGSTQSATKYLVLDSVGNVTDLTSSDPGFTTMGPGTDIDLTFPATFPSGSTPDEEIAAGASIQVEVEATNSVASDTYTSGAITPS